MTKWLIVGAAAIATSGCVQDVVCGDGTIERAGACVLSDVPPRDPAACGEGTVFNAATQQCETGTECDAETTEAIEGPDGVVVCVGLGEDTCARELSCGTPPDGDKASICGRLVDTGTSAAVQAGDGSSTASCAAPTLPTDAGPCALAITLFDALQFANDPGGATPLTVEELRVDECGRFEARNIQRPSSGFLGIAVDDGPDSGADAYTLTGVGALGTVGVAQRGIHAYATLRSTDAAWTASAGDPLGESFAQHGVYVAAYLHGSAPATGVQVTVGGQPRPAQSFYFSDADPAVRATVAPGQGMTGANGTALLVDQITLAAHSGAGGEPSGCDWPVVSGRSVVGVVFVQEFLAQLEGGGGLCP